jgi:hypothetical protein
MQEKELRFRHIHLDFHTSEDINNIAADFDADEFADTLVKANVNSINMFARCHHGWLYYDSKEFPELVHPNLKNKNLLKEQVDACHKRGIRAPIYVTIQWDNYHAQRNPEWLVITKDGKQEGTPPYEAGFYRFLCVNTPYKEFLKRHVKEILQMFDVDGFWFDIMLHRDCSCYWCRKEMMEKGIDPSDDKARKEFGIFMLSRFKSEMSAFVRKHKKDAHIFYNAGHVGVAKRPIKNAYSHFELESLASGFWGIMHFPLTIRYARTLGLECLGMTGKFHTAWGDFHSFKNDNFLKYECMRTIALNAKICIGDQLHPDGKICKYTYDLIGKAYKLVEEREAWCKEAVPVTEIGVFHTEEYESGDLLAGMNPAILGVTRMLQEGGYQFDIIDSKADYGKYKLLILPDAIPVSKDFAAKLKKYISKGGKVLATFESGLDENKKQFDSGIFGVELTGDGPKDLEGKLGRGRYFTNNNFSDYVMPNKVIGKNLPVTEHVMYLRGTEIKAVKGSKVLMDTIKPYFDRTFKHYCSHLQTPSSGKKGYPAVVRKGNVIYMNHPIFTTYETFAPIWCRDMLFDAIENLMPEKLVKHDGPKSIVATINEQKSEKRWVLHLLNYVPEKKSQKVEVIEDVVPCFNIKVSVKTNRAVKSVEAVPQCKQLDFEYKDGSVEFTVDKIDGHQMVSINLK